MDTVTFRVLNKENKEFQFKIDEKKLIDVRIKLCNEYDNKDMFCIIECILKYPIRKFGILTLNPGIVGSIYDDELLNRFNIGGKTIDIKISFEKPREDRRKKINKSAYSSNLSKYSPFSKNKSKKEIKSFVYKEDDFPPLG